MMRGALGLLAAASLAVSCGEDASAGAAMITGPAECVLGTGQLAFVTIQNTDVIPIIHGPQGGYHIWGAVRAKNIDPAGLRLTFTLALASTGTVVNTVRIIRSLTPVAVSAASPPGWSESVGSYVYVPDPRVIDGQSVRMSVDAVDAAGHTAHDERLITPQLQMP